MIGLARAAVRRFRSVARRGLLRRWPNCLGPPVRITADNGTVTLAAHLGEVIVALRTPMPEESKSGSLIVPLSDLERFEGTGSEIVTLEAKSNEKGVAKWRTRESAMSAEFSLTECDQALPEKPTKLISVPPEFPSVLHEAGRTAARDSGKYAFDCIQIRGKVGQVIGTDCKQAFIQGGFVFPFTDDLVLPAVPLFGSKELAAERAVSIGLWQDWLYLVVGLWQIWLKADPEKRFPNVEDAIPKAPGTRVVFDDRDAEKRLAVLPEMPGADEDFQPITLDLGRTVSVRARAGDKSEIVEVALPASQAIGPDVLVIVNRTFLGRALALGFREFRCANPERPIVAQDASRTYLIATLDPKCAVPSATSAKRAAATAQVPVSPVRPLPDSPLPTRRIPVMPREASVPERNGHHPDSSNGELLDPLVEAEGLRAALTEAAARAIRLVNALKQFRKERRALASAFSTLKHFNLSP